MEEQNRGEWGELIPLDMQNMGQPSFLENHPISIDKALGSAGRQCQKA